MFIAILLSMEKSLDKANVQTFILTQNEFGQRVYKSQTDKTKRYIFLLSSYFKLTLHFSYVIDDEGNMVQYQPPASERVQKLELCNVITEDFDDMITDDESSHLGMMNSLESASDFDNNLLMQELDSDLMNEDSHSSLIMQHMDIQEPLSKLGQLLEQRLGIELAEYSFYLQGKQLVNFKVSFTSN